MTVARATTSCTAGAVAAARYASLAGRRRAPAVRPAIVDRGRRASTAAGRVNAAPMGGVGPVEVITFDLDDTLWPTWPVVGAANQAFVDFCQKRIPGFPDCAGVNAYMKTIRKERKEASEAKGERHYPLSYASLRIAGGYRAALACGFPEDDAIAVVSRGYHIAWIPTRGSEAERLLFDGVVEAFTKLRAQYPNAAIGSITNGLGSAAGAGLGEFFDFEISADALIDEMMVHEDDARKPSRFPFELAMKYAKEHATPWSGDPSRWVHVGDDLLNDCQAAKVHGFRTVHVEHPDVVPYEPGGGGSYPGDPAREEAKLDYDALVDAKVASIRELPDVLAQWD